MCLRLSQIWFPVKASKRVTWDANWNEALVPFVGFHGFTSVFVRKSILARAGPCPFELWRLLLLGNLPFALQNAMHKVPRPRFPLRNETGAVGHPQRPTAATLWVKRTAASPRSFAPRLFPAIRPKTDTDPFLEAPLQHQLALGVDSLSILFNHSFQKPDLFLFGFCWSP